MTFKINDTIARKGDIPNIDSALGEIDLSNYVTNDGLTRKLNSKVDKQEGKKLSSNDYTDYDKEKLQSIPNEAKYTDTIYTAGEGLKLEGGTFTIDETIAKKSDIKEQDLSDYAKIDQLNKVFESKRFYNWYYPTLGVKIMEDKLESWQKVPAGYYFVAKNNIVNQPSDFGIIRVLKQDNQFTIIWESMPQGDIYRKSGNHLTMSEWIRINGNTYQAGRGIKLENSTFTLAENVAYKEDIPDKIELTPEQKLELKGDRGEQGPKGEDGKFDVSNITTSDIDKLTEKLYEPGKDYKSIKISTFEIKFYDATNNIQIRNADRSRGKTLTIDLANGLTRWH